MVSISRFIYSVKIAQTGPRVAGNLFDLDGRLGRRHGGQLRHRSGGGNDFCSVSARPLPSWTLNVDRPCRSATGLTAIRCDITSEDEVAGCGFAQLADAPLSVLVNNAGISLHGRGDGPLADLDLAVWDTVRET